MSLNSVTAWEKSSMEIVRGNLEDISRPASSEQTGSRVSSVSLPHSDRIDSTSPFELIVLTNDAADIQCSSAETTINSSARGPGKSQSHAEDTGEEEEDSKLQRAIEEMKKLDAILSEKMCIEKKVKQQRKELQATLWQELLQNKPHSHSESAQEAMNTRLFLSLEEAPTGTEEDDFVPVFETQLPECEHSGVQREKRPKSLTESFELSHVEHGEEQSERSRCGASRGKKKHKDFVKRNIELVSEDPDQVFFTKAEEERLAELLLGVDKEEEESARGADSEEDMWTVSVLTGDGYTPEPSDLQQLIDIDAKICRLVPVEEFLSVQSSYTNLSTSQGRGSEVGWKCDGDPQPGETVLQDIKERRAQETRLLQIQQQLEILVQGQEMTNASPDLTEEQLLSLLEECERTESRRLDLEINQITA